MFIVNLTYIKSIKEVEKYLDNHIEYLNKQYSLENFICSGRKNPRIGGVILAKAKNINIINEIIEEDPFFINKIAKYDITEFIPTKYVNGFEKFINIE